MAELVRNREALALPGMFRVDDDDGQRVVCLHAHQRLDARDLVGQLHTTNLDPFLVRELAEIGDRVIAQLPALAQGNRGPLNAFHIANHAFPRQVGRARVEMDDAFDLETALDLREDSSRYRRVVLDRRELLFADSTPTS